MVNIDYCRYYFGKQSVGGDERDRTADPLLARQVLSQLSYAPILFWPLLHGHIRFKKIRTFYARILALLIGRLGGTESPPSHFLLEETQCAPSKPNNVG